MSLMGKLASVVAGAGLLASAGNADGQGVLYDDFNSGSLNSLKWTEYPGSNLTTEQLTEHGVSISEEGIPYHTASGIVADRGTALEMKGKTFTPGDFVSYNVNYVSGEGNRISTIRIDGNGTYTSLFGFWNSLGDGGVGNDFGKYSVRLNFLEGGIYPEITIPSGEVRTTRTIIPYPTSGINDHTFGIVTRTGHNGMAHMDYDNFFVGQIPEPTTSLLLLGGLSVIAMNGMRKKD
ncbi:MAG: PEP-CTERM sorting domain-containing protein [Nanoarchaeota archaeon]